MYELGDMYMYTIYDMYMWIYDLRILSKFNFKSLYKLIVILLFHLFENLLCFISFGLYKMAVSNVFG